MSVLLLYALYFGASFIAVLALCLILPQLSDTHCCVSSAQRSCCRRCCWKRACSRTPEVGLPFVDRTPPPVESTDPTHFTAEAGPSSLDNEAWDLTGMPVRFVYSAYDVGRAGVTGTFGVVSLGIRGAGAVVSFPFVAASHLRNLCFVGSEDTEDVNTSTNPEVSLAVADHQSPCELLEYTTEGANGAVLARYDLTNEAELLRWMASPPSDVIEGRTQTDTFTFRVVGSEVCGLRRLEGTVKSGVPKTFRKEEVMGDFKVGQHTHRFQAVDIPAGMFVRGSYSTTQEFVDWNDRTILPTRHLKFKIISAPRV